MTRAQIVAAARLWIGTPYRHQASLRGVGCDCLGLVRGIWRETIGPEPEDAPPYTADWLDRRGDDPLLAAALRWFAPAQEIAPGDVLLFRWRDDLAAKHLGVATSPTTMIHAHDAACVCETAIAPAWRRRLAGVFSFPGL